MAKKIRPNGRPKIKFKEKYCEMLVDHMAEGFSYESFAGYVGVSKMVIYRWEKENKKFLDAKQRGFAKCLLYYERIGRLGMMGKIKNFNGHVFRIQMANRFGWADKKQIEIEDIKPSIIHRRDGSKEVLGYESTLDDKNTIETTGELVKDK